MSNETPSTTASGNLPDWYDRQLGALHDLPDVVKTKPATIRTVPPLGIGGTMMFTLQTFRQRERGDSIFLECVSGSGVVRLVIPPQVANLIARQRDSVTAKVRSRVATQRARENKAAGILPVFMRPGAAKPRPRKRKGAK